MVAIEVLAALRPLGVQAAYRAEDSPGETDCEIRPLDDRTGTPRASRGAQRDSLSSLGPAYGMSVSEKQTGLFADSHEA